MYTIKIKRLSPDSILPSYATAGDAGMDLFAIERVEIPSGEVALIKTGLAIELPKDTEAQIRPRSGLALRHAITILNSPGTIDQGYRGEIGVIIINHGKNTFIVEKHMKIAQMVIAPAYQANIVEAEINGDSERGISGFGSTGI